MSRAPANRRIVDATGNPVSGGKLYTLTAGASLDPANYKTTYSDYGLTVPNSNPVEAGADGVLPPVFMTDGERYKFIETDASGNTLRTEDNIEGNQITTSDLITRVKQIASNPVDYGAVGDGVADEYSYVQEALDGVSGNGVVDLLGLTFRCDSQLRPSAGTTLRNGTLDFSSCTDDEFIRVRGTLGTPTDLTADVADGDGLVAVTSASGLAAGDLINIYDGQDYIDDINRGEIGVIQSIATLDVNLEGKVQDDYATASSAAARKVNTVDDVVLEDLKIIGAEAIAGAHEMLALFGTRRARVTRCDFSAIDSFGVAVSGSYDVKIDKCTFRNGAPGLTGAAVLVADACQKISVTDCTFTDCEQAIAIGKGTVHDTSAPSGIPRFVDVVGCSFSYGAAAALSYAQIDVDDCAQHVTIARNRFDLFGASGAVAVRADCVHLRILENICDSVGGSSLFDLGTKVPGHASRKYTVLVRNNLLRTDGKGVDVDFANASGGGSMTRYDISGNAIYSDGDAIEFTAASNDDPAITDVVIAHNTGGGAIDIDWSFNPAITRLRMLGNEVGDVDIDSTTDKITGLRLQNNEITGHLDTDGCVAVTLSGGVHGDYIEVKDAQVITVTGIDLFKTTIGGPGVRVVNPGTAFVQCLITGCRVNVTGDDAIEIDAQTTGGAHLTITGCNLKANDQTINMLGIIDHFVITGNDCQRTDDTSDNIHIAGTASGNMSNGRISGNIIKNGTYGIALTNGSNVVELNNNFNSCATANLSGSFEGGLVLGTSQDFVIKAKTTTLTSAQIKALAATPQTVVPAVAGKAHIFLAASLQLNHGGSNDFTEPSSPDDLQFNLVDGAGEQVSSNITAAGFITEAADSFASAIMNTGIDGMLTAAAVNVPIVLWNSGGEYGGNAANDNTLTIIVLYAEATVV